MASTIGLLPKKHFLCSLCEHIFSNPVTTPCGHSFCKVCLRKYWTKTGAECCPSCKKDFGSRPHLSVNRILADVTENYRMTRQAAKQKGHHSEEKTDKVLYTVLKQGIHTGIRHISTSFCLPEIRNQSNTCFYPNALEGGLICVLF